MTNRNRPKEPGTPKPDPVKASGRKLDAPTFYASTAQVLVSGNDATLLFTRPHPAIMPDGTLGTVPIKEAVALVHMSIAGMKDLALILSDFVRRLEQQTGQIPSELSGGSDFTVAGISKRGLNGH